MYMEDARFKDKEKRIRNNSGERMSITSCSGVNLLFMASLNVFRTQNANILCFRAGNKENV